MNAHSKDEPSYQRAFVKKKRRDIDKIGSILNEWYGEERGRDELKAYFPKVVSVADVLKGIVSRENYKDFQELAQLQKAWPVIAGPDVSANSEIVSFKDGIIKIQTRNSVWLSELKNFYAGIIEKKIRSSFKNMSIKKILYLSAGK